jgi:hypothetical protein
MSKIDRISRRARRLVGASAIAIVTSATSGWADNGSFETVASFTTNYTKLEQGEQVVTGGSIHGSVAVVRSSGGAFAEGTNCVLDCIVFAKKSDSGLELEAPCVNTDPSGDKLFYVSRRKAGDLTVGGEGIQELKGGTGKYAGLSGSCRFRTEYLPGNQAVTRQQCQWQRP